MPHPPQGVHLKRLCQHTALLLWTDCAWAPHGQALLAAAVRYALRWCCCAALRSDPWRLPCHQPRAGGPAQPLGMGWGHGPAWQVRPAHGAACVRLRAAWHALHRACMHLAGHPCALAAPSSSSMRPSWAWRHAPCRHAYDRPSGHCPMRSTSLPRVHVISLACMHVQDACLHRHQQAGPVGASGQPGGGNRAHRLPTRLLRWVPVPKRRARAGNATPPTEDSRRVL